MARRPQSLVYGVDDLPPAFTTLLLGAQQVALMSMYLIVVVIVVREAGAPAQVAESAVSLALVALGLSTALQALWKGPVGSGYLAPPVISAIYLSPSLLAVHAGGLPVVFGMTIVAGLSETLLAASLRRLRAVFPPLVCGFIVAAVGFDLGVIGIGQVLDVKGVDGSKFHAHVVTALLTLACIVGFSVWGKGMLRLLCSLLGILAGFVLGAALGLVPAQAITQLYAAPLVAFPSLAHVDYRFDAAVLVPFLLAGLAAGLRTVGVVTTCQRINDADWKRPDLRSIRGGVLADGVGCAIGGCLGVVGMGSAPSLVGVSQASGATSRYIAFAVLLLCLILASSPKLAAVFLALPRSVVGAGLVFTASFMIAGGLQIIAAHELDTRKTCIIGVSLLLGLSRVIFPDYYAGLPAALRALTGSLLTLSMVTAILLNLVFRIGLRRTAQLSVEVGEQTTARVESLATSIRDVAKSWKIEADVVERAAAAGARAVRLIHDNGLADGAITARLSFDELTFEVQLLYQGDLLQIPRQRPLSDERLLEEQPFVAGLSGFMGGVYADRVTAASSDGSCQLRLIFEA